MASDEAFIHEIALALRDRQRMDPYTQDQTSEGAGVSAKPSEDLVVRRGMECGISEEALRETSCPSTLRDSMSRAIETATRQGRADVLAPLPLFVENARTVAKQRTTSVRDGALAEWLLSEDVAQWRQDRQVLFPHRSSASS